MILLELFFSFIQVGLFSFGGGYASLALIQDQVVHLHHWLTFSEFNDLITISQMTPGPIAINSATFVGQKVAGLPGSVVATLGCILPSCLIVSILAYLYMRYRKMDMLQGILNTLRPAVVAMILTAGISILLTALFGEEVIISLHTLKLDMLVIFIIAVILLQWKKCNPIYIMILCGFLRLMEYIIFKI